ncbi:hypothetical protein CFIO01_06346 [Colletotrichum fioriniae PJ7]|uniref:Uncharacterized protein n=1 Tax=Colletotrichum fioriniae PJ7 TaxID=1445577 RepID=A0A010QVJ5_9PEZI|nr:hypothetical protein CFIO01_06346 [Colletotrichum fioriniae PJ7]
MVDSGGETNDGGGFGGRCVFPYKGEAGTAGTARMGLEPGGPLPVPSAAGGHCAAEASGRCCPLVWARAARNAILAGGGCASVACATLAPNPTRQKYPANYLTASRSRLLCAASSEQPEPSLYQAPPGPWPVISRIFAPAIPARR